MERKLGWQLKDIIMIGILGVIFAVIYLAFLYLATSVSVALTPFGLSPFGNEIFYGIWFMAASLAAYVLQKPGVAIVTEVIAAMLEFMMGNMGGALVLAVGSVQGAGSELGFAIFRYRRFDMLSMCLSGVFAAIASFIFGYFTGAYALIAPGMLAAMLAARIGSSVLFAGVISKLAGDGLAKTGVLKSYPLGRKYKPAEVLEDEA